MWSTTHDNCLLCFFFGPLVMVMSWVALWENEGRFDYADAAAAATAIVNPGYALPGEPVAYSSALDTSVEMPTTYVEPMPGYIVVYRRAQVYQWWSGTEGVALSGGRSGVETWSPTHAILTSGANSNPPRSDPAGINWVN